MKLIELFCLLNGLSLLGLIFIRNPIKMARIETNTNKNLDQTIILLIIVYLTLVLGLKCW